MTARASSHPVRIKASFGIAMQFIASLPCGAVEWTGGNGGFGAAENWAGGVVPDGQAAAITNGGSAGLDSEDSFSITTLAVGGHSGTGGMVHSGGCLTATRVMIGGDDVPGGSGDGSYTLANGTLKCGANELWVGSKGGEGSLELSGNALVSSIGRLSVGREGATGVVRLDETASIEVLSSDLAVGCNSNGLISSMTVSDSARVTVSGEIWIGWQGNSTNRGVMAVEGHGLVATGKAIVIGRSGATGNFSASGHAVVNAGGTFVCGTGPGSRAEVTVSDDAHLHSGKQIWLGDNGASARVVVNGGCVSAHASLVEDPSGAGIAFRNDGELVLNGGEVSTPGFIKVAGHAAVIFNGGTVRATGMTPSGGFFAGFAAGDLKMESGGLTFDTEELSILIGQPLQGSGTLTKVGAGSLTLASTSGHAGDSVVGDGTLVLDAPALSDHHTLRISGETSRLRMNHAQVDRVARLEIDGVVQSAGRYVAAGSSGSGVEMDRLLGGGALLVSHGPDDHLFSDWAAEHETAATFGGDTDEDGLPDGIEHILGTDPDSSTPSPLRVTRPDMNRIVLHHPLAERLGVDVARDYEWSRDLNEWRRSGETDSGGLSLTVTETTDEGFAEATFSTPHGIPDRLFLRISARQTVPAESP